jgi:hypothetical protein
MSTLFPLLHGFPGSFLEGILSFIFFDSFLISS